MTQASTYRPRTASPTSFTLVVLLHGAAIAALVMAKMDMPEKAKFPPTEVDLIPIEPPPEPIVAPPRTPLPPQAIRQVEPVVPPPDQIFDDFDWRPDTTTRISEPPVPPQPPAEPVREPPRILEPVRREARLDPRSDLKPPYPRSQEIEGNEGSVTVRVTIGADGRVRAAEKVRATNDDFFQATLRHALRNWRFKPATLDGRPIETSKVMTVHFSLEDGAG